MKNSKTSKTKISALQIFVMISLLFLVPVSAYSDNADTVVKFKPEYKIKRVSDGTVTIYSIDNKGEKEEYIFKDFNADVVLSLYRRIRVSQVTSNLAKKYYLSEVESRRNVKRVLNVLDHWEMVTQ